ncbi:DUF7683 domain-containing protein [Thermasporomyces composti]|jgi:hypothetical protein|uniref:DUF7683 domain-containing protein n=1 Tax=Thermasporomyces composti TaxID=696763 RepID=A0A3D9V2R2_THECX|nr:hypothetical protein [Thermasporomyces composti]REF36008.1 hypothetical protein DFJ64_1403 [Thermasporomyces composti]
MRVKREIAAYGEDDEFVFAQEFPEEKISELRPLFDYGDDDELYAGAYEVTDDIRDRVAAILGIELKPDLSYYVEASEAAD